MRSDVKLLNIVMGTKPWSNSQFPGFHFQILQMICRTTFLLMYAGPTGCELVSTIQ